MIKRNCDICAQSGIASRATVDAKTTQGPWAYMCAAHNEVFGTGVAGLTNILKDMQKGGDE